MKAQISQLMIVLPSTPYLVKHVSFVTFGSRVTGIFDNTLGLVNVCNMYDQWSISWLMAFLLRLLISPNSYPTSKLYVGSFPVLFLGVKQLGVNIYWPP